MTHNYKVGDKFYNAISYDKKIVENQIIRIETHRIFYIILSYPKNIDEDEEANKEFGFILLSDSAGKLRKYDIDWIPFSKLESDFGKSPGEAIQKLIQDYIKTIKSYEKNIVILEEMLK